MWAVCAPVWGTVVRRRSRPYRVRGLLRSPEPDYARAILITSPSQRRHRITTVGRNELFVFWGSRRLPRYLFVEAEHSRQSARVDKQYAVSCAEIILLCEIKYGIRSEERR